MDGRLQVHTDSFDFGLDFRNDSSGSTASSSAGSQPPSPVRSRADSDPARERRLRAAARRAGRLSRLRAWPDDRALTEATGVAYRGGVPAAGASEPSAPPPKRSKPSMFARWHSVLQAELSETDRPGRSLPYRVTALLLKVTLWLPASVVAVTLGYAFGLALGMMDAIRHIGRQVPSSLWRHFFRAARRGRGSLTDTPADAPEETASNGSMSPGGRTPSLSGGSLPSPTASLAAFASSVPSPLRMASSSSGSELTTPAGETEGPPPHRLQKRL